MALANVRRWLAAVLLLSLAPLSWALPPYMAGTKQAAGEVKAQIEQVERKLQAEAIERRPSS